MKAATQTRFRASVRGVLATLLSVGLLSTAGLARDGGSDDNTMFGGGSSGGIGTVPVVAGNNTSGPIAGSQGELGGATEVQPTLRIVGTQPEVEAVVSDIRLVDPTGGYRWETVGQEFTVEVFGNTALELDRAALARSSVEVQLSVGPLFAGGVAVLETGTGRRAVQTLASGNLTLPLLEVSNSGLAERGLRLTARSKTGTTAAWSFTGQAGVLRLEQRH